jgi:hypothetical protein
MNNGAHIEKGPLEAVGHAVESHRVTTFEKKDLCRLQVLYIFVNVSPVRAGAEEVKP